jgi:DNA-binding NarL/FixJ family response regulator
MAGWKQSPEVVERCRQAKLGKQLIVRRLKTQEEDRPIVEAFKAGKSRKQICCELHVTGPKVQKALVRWKARMDPDLLVGSEYQYVNSGLSLQKNALNKNQKMIDMVLLEGKSRKQVADELDVSYAFVKNVVGRYQRRITATMKCSAKTLGVEENHGK